MRHQPFIVSCPVVSACFVPRTSCPPRGMETPQSSVHRQVPAYLAESQGGSVFSQWVNCVADEQASSPGCFCTPGPLAQPGATAALSPDQVFGCRLDALCQRENDMVPRFVRLCVEAVEKRGLDADGIYRVSGNLAVIQKLRFVERLSLADPEWDDVHVVTGALKLFFRELPEPLVPFALFDAFVAAVKLPASGERVQRLGELVQSLPPPNYATLRYILAHLRKVMEHADVNRMTRQNIGIVFGPTLLRPEKELASMAVDMVHQNQAVELLLSEFQRIFPAPGTH
uniref:Rho-GAP domain-containing protein n=1 Tax=Chelydra serpentina TaxID=8475 RepID=A0A8C3SEM0_CHESE